MLAGVALFTYLPVCQSLCGIPRENRVTNMG
jgi:hypothetical protein